MNSGVLLPEFQQSAKNGSGFNTGSLCSVWRSTWSNWGACSVIDRSHAKLTCDISAARQSRASL